MSTFILASAAGAEEFSQAFIQKQYNAMTPAICVVDYTTSITAATGEVSKGQVSAPGLLVTADGLVVTHGHMELDNTDPFNVRVTVGTGDAQREYPAKLLRKPDDINLVFLQIEAAEGTRFPFVRFDHVPLEFGQQVMLLGVLTEPFDFAPTFNLRRVSAILDKPRTTYVLDLPVAVGFMTAPIVDAQGRVVGVLGYDLSPAEGGELYTRHGQPLVYQADLFARYIANPPGTETIAGEGPEAWLGILTQPLTDNLAEYWGLPQEGGIVVSTIVPGSPAETAGFQRGDVIVAVDGTVMRAKTDREVVGFSKLVRELGPDKEATFRFYRDGELQTLSVTLMSRPKTSRDAGEHEDKVLGLVVRELTTDVRLLLNMDEGVQGVIVRRVLSGSAADVAGMQPGVVILRIGEYPVEDLDAYQTALTTLAASMPEEVPVFAMFRSVTGFFRLEPRWSPADEE
jgi:serine protease Do